MKGRGKCGCRAPLRLRSRGHPRRHGIALFNQFNHSSIARVQVCGWRERGKKSRWRALRCKAPPLACCRVRCGRFRCARARVPGRVAMLSQCIAVVQVCSGVWQPANVLCAHGAMLCNVVQMWPVWCRACVYDGRSVITRFAPRVCTRERAGSRLLEGGVLLCFGWCCVPMFGGAQHFTLHRCVHTAARVLPVRIAAAAGARGSRHRVAWQPGQ